MWVFSLALMKGIDHGPSHVGQALASEVRHARSDATRFVTASCTEHRLMPAHSTDYIPHIRQTKSLHNTA